MEYEKVRQLAVDNLAAAEAALASAEAVEDTRATRADAEHTMKVENLQRRLDQMVTSHLYIEQRARERSARRIATLSAKVREARYRLDALSAIGNSAMMQEVQNAYGPSKA